MLFVGLILMALMDRRRPLTARWVLVLAGIAVATGAVLKLIDLVAVL